MQYLTRIETTGLKPNCSTNSSKMKIKNIIANAVVVYQILQCKAKELGDSISYVTNE